MKHRGQNAAFTLKLLQKLQIELKEFRVELRDLKMFVNHFYIYGRVSSDLVQLGALVKGAKLISLHQTVLTARECD